MGVDVAAGLMLIPVRVAAVTVSAAAGDVLPPNEAVAVVVPTATPVATPVALLIVATLLFAVDQVAWLVMSAVAPFE